GAPAGCAPRDLAGSGRRRPAGRSRPAGGNVHAPVPRGTRLMTRLLRADVAARRRMILGLALATAVFVVALASIEAIGGLSDIGRQAFGEAPPALSALAGSRSGLDVFTS